MLHSLDDARDLLARASAYDGNALRQPGPEPTEPDRREVVVLGEIPGHPAVVEDVPPGSAQRPRQNCRIHHGQVVGADQDRSVALLDQGPITSPKLGRVLDAVPQQHAQREDDRRNPDDGRQPTSLALESQCGTGAKGERGHNGCSRRPWPRSTARHRPPYSLRRRPRPRPRCRRRPRSRG